MDRDSIPRAARGNKGRKRKRAPGLAVIERDGFWHIHGTLVAQGRAIRIRKSTKLPARAELWEEADNERIAFERDLRRESRGEVCRGPYLSIAAEHYLKRARRRPLGATSILYIERAAKEFGLRHVGDIHESEWSKWIDGCCRNVKSATRERMLNTIVAFLSWCARKPRRWGTAPSFDRDKEARNPRRRARRPVKDLSMALIAHASPHLAAQMWTEWSTGARVSSILHGCRLSDLILAPGREQITFHDTKNGETVTAHLHARAAEALRGYLKVRGRLHDREGPLFLTERNKPYSTRSCAVQNRTAFEGMKRRARAALRKDGLAQARALAQSGQLEAAAAVVARLRGEHRLLGRITQHWFRHLLATKMRGDIRAAMDQAGWIDERSVMAYTIDVPEHRRRLVDHLDSDGSVDTPLTRDGRETVKK